MDVIDDRTVLEVGNVQYVACIVADSYPSNPLKDWSQSVSFYVPNWGTGNTQRWINEQLDNTLPDTDLSRVSNALYERTMAASWYEDAPASDFLKMFRQADPSGIYFIVQWNDSGYGDTIKFMDDDCDDDSGYAIAYRTAAQIREDHMVKRITAKVREQAEHNIRVDIRTQNAYFSGEVYMYELLRQVLDDDGETLSSEDVNLWELGGDPSPTVYGWDGIAELYEAAKVNAEYDHANREDISPGSPGEVLYCQQCGEAELSTDSEYLHGYCDTCWMQSDGVPSLDLFDAASYPEPGIDDAIGAFHARLNEGFAAIGECTRKLSPIAIG